MPRPLLPVNRQFGPYLCTRLIGANANSTVYQALDPKSNELIALRVMELDENKKNEQDVSIGQCLAELERLQGIIGPNLVPISDFGVDTMSKGGGTLYIAMPLLNGGSLADRLREREMTEQPIPSLGETADLLAQIGSALTTLHDAGWIHGQVEPRNILFDEKGIAYLADAGLTKLFKVVYALQSTGSFTTGEYSSPEQWQGERLQPATDQYSLACTTYHLVSGRPPFSAASIFKLMNQHLTDLPEPVHRVRGGVPGSITMLLYRAMAKEPSDRFPSVSAFCTAFIEAVVAYRGEPTNFFTFELS